MAATVGPPGCIIIMPGISGSAQGAAPPAAVATCGGMGCICTEEGKLPAAIIMLHAGASEPDTGGVQELDRHALSERPVFAAGSVAGMGR